MQDNLSKWQAAENIKNLPETTERHPPQVDDTFGGVA